LRFRAGPEGSAEIKGRIRT